MLASNGLKGDFSSIYVWKKSFCYKRLANSLKPFLETFRKQLTRLLWKVLIRLEATTTKSISVFNELPSSTESSPRAVHSHITRGSEPEPANHPEPEPHPKPEPPNYPEAEQLSESEPPKIQPAPNLWI